MRKLLQSHRSHFLEPWRKKLPQKSENIPVRKNMRELKFIEAFSSSKGSPGQVEDKKDTHAKNLCQNYQNLSQKSSVSPKALLEALLAFWQNARKFFAELCKVFRWRSKKIKYLGFHWNKFSSEKFYGHVKRNFQNHAIFLPKVRKSHDQAQKPQFFILLRNLSSLEKTLLEASITYILTAVSKNCSP